MTATPDDTGVDPRAEPPPSEVYTHGHHEAVLRSHRWRTAENSAAYLLPHLDDATTVIDIGCGPGTLTADLAARVAPARVLAVDTEAEVVEQARRHADERGLANLDVVAGDFRDLDIRHGGFDVVHAHQVLQHVSDPVAALRHMAHLARPGGIVAVRDADYGAMVWSPASDGLDRWRALYLAVSERNGGDATAGRHLLGWARQAGLRDLTYSTSTWTFATPEDRTWWAESWADRVEKSSFATHALEHGLASPDELADLAADWRAWATQPDGVFVVLHGELVGHAAAPIV